jgi:hypothetical protein
MSRTIDTPRNVIHTDITFHLAHEQDVLGEAGLRDLEVTYLPREGASATLVMASWHDEDGSTHIVARVR